MSEKVTAEYRNEDGELLWSEDPYPFKRKFAVGQQWRSNDGWLYKIIKADFIGKFGDGVIYYVVKQVKIRKAQQKENKNA